MAHGQDADQNSIKGAQSGLANSQGVMPSPNVLQVHNGEASTAPQDAAGVPGLESLDGCKLQVAQLARDETQLEAELQNFERLLEDARKLKKALEEKIVQLDQPLRINLESVELSDDDMKVLTSSGTDADFHRVVSVSQPFDTIPVLPQQQQLGADCTAEFIVKDSTDRLSDPKDVAESNYLQAQHAPPILFGPTDPEAVPRHFGNVPFMSPLPEDCSVAAILACNRYRSAVSHIDSLQRLPQHIQQAAFAAQHYMSGRQWIMTIKPQAGTAWSLPGVQQTIELHQKQVHELSAALQAVHDQQQVSAESSARQLAAQLWSTQTQPQRFSDHPARDAVSEHLHNFRCAMPAQLNQREQWRSMFVDDGGFVQDPVALLQEASFTSPWTKREREVMDNVLGEHGKRFACVAKEVGTRSIADCIDRYYKVHLRDEFKPTWRKMARIKRAVDGKNKREEHSKVLAPVGKVLSRPRHSAWAGTAAQLGNAGGLQWPPMSAARLTAAVSGTAGDFGMTLASLGSMPEPNRVPGRCHGRRRGTTNVFESMHAPAPTQTGSAIAGADQMPTLQIEGLRTQTGSRAVSVAEASHAGLGMPFFGNDSVATGIATGEQPIGNSLPCSTALHATGLQRPQGSGQVFSPGFPALEQEIATEAAREVASMHVSCTAHHGAVQGKGSMAHTEQAQLSTEQTHRPAASEIHSGRGMHFLQGNLQQHQS